MKSSKKGSTRQMMGITAMENDQVNTAMGDLVYYAVKPNNIGVLPVCGADGRVCGLLTDRDIVTRCLASGHSPESTAVREVMTASVVCARADMDTTEAAGMMGREQIRRLPVVEGGKLCGMVSLGDLATFRDTTREASQALSQISSHLSSR